MRLQERAFHCEEPWPTPGSSVHLSKELLAKGEDFKALTMQSKKNPNWMSTSLHGEISGAFTFPSLKQPVFEESGIPKMVFLLSIPEAILELQCFPVLTGGFWLLPLSLVRFEPCRTRFLLHLGPSWTGSPHSLTCYCSETIATQREGKVPSGELFCPEYCLCFISRTILNPFASVVSKMSCILQSKLPGIDKLPKFIFPLNKGTPGSVWLPGVCKCCSLNISLCACRRLHIDLPRAGNSGSARMEHGV